MTAPDPATILRQPFAPEQIGKLPKISCRACSKAPGRVCQDHSKSKCKACGNYITSAHVDLDYVGHAGVTDRLLQADPAWTWEPLAIGDDGVPVINVANGEATMWVRMTVNGVTRIGVGSAPAQSFELHKQLISDAIRNVAMRFGVALDLWSKEPLPEVAEAVGDDTPPAAARKPRKSSGGGDAAPPSAVASPGVPATDREAPPAGVEPAASSGGEVGTAPAGSTTAPGGRDATGGGDVETAPTAPDPAPAGGPTLKDANPSGYSSLNRWCRARAKDWPDDLRQVWWEALAWAVSAGRTTHLGELTPPEASDFRSRVDDHANGRARWVETDDPRFLGWTLTSEEAA